MKQLILLVTLALVAVGFSKKPKQPVEIPPPVVSAPTVTPSQPKSDLAWYKEPKATEWDYYLDEALHGYPETAAIKTPCKKLSLKPCTKQLLSIIAQRESGFKTDTQYKEDFSDANGPVISRGLFQISQLSANQSAYGCNIKVASDLHVPQKNIVCAVKILAYQAKKTGTLIDGKKGGCGAYWSVCRDKAGSGSYEAIMKYMGQF